MLFYSYRLYLAAMHYNENAGRAQATTALGAAQYSLSYPRSKQDAGGYTICKKLVNSTFCKSDNSYHSSQKSYISERMWCDIFDSFSRDSDLEQSDSIFEGKKESSDPVSSAAWRLYCSLQMPSTLCWIRLSSQLTVQFTKLWKNADHNFWEVLKCLILSDEQSI